MMFLDHQVKRWCNTCTEHIWTSDLDLFNPMISSFLPCWVLPQLLPNLERVAHFHVQFSFVANTMQNHILPQAMKAYKWKTKPNLYLKLSQWIPNQLAELGGENKYFYPSCALPFYGYQFPEGASICIHLTTEASCISKPLLRISESKNTDVIITSKVAG